MTEAEVKRFFEGGLRHGTLPRCFWVAASSFTGPKHQGWVEQCVEILLEVVNAEEPDPEVGA